jgi:pheromone shutdown-related protein TraB
MAATSNVSVVEHAGRQIHVIGTAHISKRSVEEVRRLIEEVRPDTVCVELDQTRHDALVDESRWRKLDIFTIIRQKKVLFLMTSLALSAYQRKMGEKLGVKPGAELLAAVRSAEAVGAKVVLADRDIQATLKRTWHSLSFLDKLKLSTGLLAVPFSLEEISEERIEELKDRDTISEMLDEFARAMPGVKEPLIDERDRYLMSMVRDAPGQTIVAVVGAGHVAGMLQHLHSPVDREELSKIPAGSKVTRALKWVIPIVVLGAFYWGYTKHSGDDFLHMVYAWILPNSLVAAFFSILAGAKPLTVLTAFVASPITSLNPTIGAGMVAGLVEAWLRRPTVSDCERISEDMLSLRGIYRNRFTRVLLVAVAATVGSALGAWIGATWVVTLL